MTKAKLHDIVSVKATIVHVYHEYLELEFILNGKNHVITASKKDFPHTEFVVD